MDVGSSFVCDESAVGGPRLIASELEQFMIQILITDSAGIFFLSVSSCSCSAGVHGRWDVDASESARV